MSSQVRLLKCQLSIVSIPLTAYPYFSHGVFQLLLNVWHESLEDSQISIRRQSLPPDNKRLSGLSLDHQDLDLEKFVNVSFTPFECSLICPTRLVRKLFGSQLDLVGEKLGVQVLDGSFKAIQIDGDGSDGGYRVLEVTAPLALAKIPVFFIPTFFSDIVLVPADAENKVMKALQAKGFEFSNLSESYVASESVRSFDSPEVKALSEEKCELFKGFSVAPHIDFDLKLLFSVGRNSSEQDEQALYLHLVKVLLAPPSYFSVTIADDDLSILADSEAIQDFPDDALQGCQTDYVTPIAFDFRNLPQDSTGIITGIASILRSSESGTHMSYLSTALSGVVLVNDKNAASAKRALMETLQNGK